MIVRARFILPVVQPPIENGAVVIEGEKIVAAGAWPEIRATCQGEVTDLGDAIILPGLINAHCHLDYTNMAGMLPPARSFSAWIRSIVALKSTWSDSEFEQSWRRGAEMLLKSGTTSVVDIEAIAAIPPQLSAASPLNIISCQEIMSLRRSVPDLVTESVTRVAAWPGELRGLSPHAPYTTSSDLLRRVAQETQSRGWLLTSHVAESSEEFDMFAAASGPLYQWLAAQRDVTDCGKRTPIQHVEAAGALAGMIVAHANYVTDDDVRLLTERHAHVVHCPRSHDYFQHQPFPFEAMQKAGVNICLGTDSLATVYLHSPEGIELDLCAEMRCFARVNPTVPPWAILEMATVNGAKALGRKGLLGELSPGARADLIAVPATASNPYASVVQHRGPVRASLIRGRWAFRQPHENGGTIPYSPIGQPTP